VTEPELEDLCVVLVEVLLEVLLEVLVDAWVLAFVTGAVAAEEELGAASPEAPTAWWALEMSRVRPSRPGTGPW
jgi:hypothetical protein